MTVGSHDGTSADYPSKASPGFSKDIASGPGGAYRPGKLGYPVSGIMGAHSGILLMHRGPAAVNCPRSAAAAVATGR